MIPKRIDDAKSIDELQIYACVKARNDKNWAMKCVDCKMCPVGKKAEELLEIETSPAKKDVPLNSKDAFFMEAFRQKNPVDWLVKTGKYTSNASAGNAMGKWLGETRLIPEEEKKAYRIRVQKNNARIAGELAVKKTREMIEKAFTGIKTDSGKQRAALNTAKESSTGKALYGKLRYWSLKYPDLDKKYGFYEACKVFGLKEHCGKTVAELKREFGIKETEEDEVSVEDFLDELSEPAMHGDDFDGDSVLIIKQEKHESPVAKIASTANPEIGFESDNKTNQLILQSEFSRKRKALKQKLQEINEKLKGLQQQQAAINNQISVLDKAAAMFGMLPKT